MENLKGGVIILTKRYCRQILQKKAAAEGRSLPSEMGVLPLTSFNKILLFLSVGGQENNEEDLISSFWRTFSFPLQHSDTFLKCTLYKMFSQWPFCFIYFLLMQFTEPSAGGMAWHTDVTDPSYIVFISTQNDPACQERRLQTLFSVLPNYRSYCFKTSSS